LHPKYKNTSRTQNSHRCRSEAPKRQILGPKSGISLKKILEDTARHYGQDGISRYIAENRYVTNVPMYHEGCEVVWADVRAHLNKYTPNRGTEKPGDIKTETTPQKTTDRPTTPTKQKQPTR